MTMPTYIILKFNNIMRYTINITFECKVYQQVFECSRFVLEEIYNVYENMKKIEKLVINESG